MTKPHIIKPELQEDDHEQRQGDKTEPRMPDDEGGDEEMEIDFLEDEQTVVYRPSNPDEKRRAFIFYKMADPNIDGKILVESMELINKWLRDGTTPNQKERKLKAIKE